MLNLASIPRADQASPLPPPFRRLYRAHIEPQQWHGPELAAFVEAVSRADAIRKICAAVAAIEFGSTAASVAERVCNLSSAPELIDEGLSEDLEARLMETGWGDGKPTYVKHPLVLMRDPAPLLRVWAGVATAVTP